MTQETSPNAFQALFGNMIQDRLSRARSAPPILGLVQQGRFDEASQATVLVETEAKEIIALSEMLKGVLEDCNRSGIVPPPISYLQRLTQTVGHPEIASPSRMAINLGSEQAVARTNGRGGSQREVGAIVGSGDGASEMETIAKATPLVRKKRKKETDISPEKVSTRGQRKAAMGYAALELIPQGNAFLHPTVRDIVEHVYADVLQAIPDENARRDKIGDISGPIRGHIKHIFELVGAEHHDGITSHVEQLIEWIKVHPLYERVSIDQLALLALRKASPEIYREAGLIEPAPEQKNVKPTKISAARKPKEKKTKENLRATKSRDLSEREERTAYACLTINDEKTGYAYPNLRTVAEQIYGDVLGSISDPQIRSAKVNSLSGAVSQYRTNAANKLTAALQEGRLTPQLQKLVDWAKTQPEYANIEPGRLVNIMFRDVPFEQLSIVHPSTQMGNQGERVNTTASTQPEVQTNETPISELDRSQIGMLRGLFAASPQEGLASKSLMDLTHSTYPEEFDGLDERSARFREKTLLPGVINIRARTITTFEKLLQMDPSKWPSTFAQVINETLANPVYEGCKPADLLTILNSDLSLR